jgi:energy-coupling factor transport system permease protein
MARDTAIHRLSPFTKLVLALSLTCSALAAYSLWLLAALVLLCLLLLTWSKSLRRVVRAVYPYLLFFVPVLFLVQSLFWSGVSETWSIGPLEVHLEGVLYSCQVTLRLLTILFSFYLVLAATSPTDLVLDLEQRGLPPRFAFVLLATLQTIDEIKERIDVILQAQQCRGVEVSGNLIVRARAYFPLISPLIIGSLLNIESRALALELRGFNAGVPKTLMHRSEEQPWERPLRWGFILLPVVIIGVRVAWLFR